MCSNALHKFAFFNWPPEAYAAILPGRVIGAAYDQGGLILVPAEPDTTLCWGGGGEHILFHRDARAFAGQTPVPPAFQRCHLSHYDGPDVGFSEEYFLHLFSYLAQGSKDSLKFFMISKPGAWGVGNGYLQDILFRARLHPHPRRSALPQLSEVKLNGIIQAAVPPG